MGYVNYENALDTHALFYGGGVYLGHDYHDVSIAAAAEGMQALEIIRERDGRGTSDAAKSSLKATAAREAERLSKCVGLDLDSDQRKDMLAYADGQALHLFEEQYGDNY